LNKKQANNRRSTEVEKKGTGSSVKYCSENRGQGEKVLRKTGFWVGRKTFKIFIWSVDEIGGSNRWPDGSVPQIAVPNFCSHGVPYNCKGPNFLTLFRIRTS